MKPVWATCIHVDNERETALVKTKNNTFPVKLHPKIKYDVCLKDEVKIVKSSISKEWIAIDYMAMWAIV